MPLRSRTFHSASAASALRGRASGTFAMQARTISPISPGRPVTARTGVGARRAKRPAARIVAAILSGYGERPVTSS
jgi:hypothetical protein